MKAAELREISIPELEAEIHRLKEELFSIKFKHKAQPVSNPLRLRTLRREIARALTIKLEMEHKTEISSSRGSFLGFKGGGVPKKLPLKVVKQEKQTETK